MGLGQQESRSNTLFEFNLRGTGVHCQRNGVAGTFSLMAAQGGAQYTIGENLYLAKNASTLSYQVRITPARGTWPMTRPRCSK